jgi:hypothetical protein
MEATKMYLPVGLYTDPSRTSWAGILASQLGYSDPSRSALLLILLEQPVEPRDYPVAQGVGSLDHCHRRLQWEGVLGSERVFFVISLSCSPLVSTAVVGVSEESNCLLARELHSV